MYHIKPDIYVVIAKIDDEQLFVYYQMEEKDNPEDPDVRYIRENGLRIADYEPKKRIFGVYEDKNHELNDFLGSKLSVFKTLYGASDYIFEKSNNAIKVPDT